MEYRKLGKWGTKVSAVGLGSYLTIGYKLDEKTSQQTIARAYDLGVNYFDTANAYNFGEAEKVLGRNLKAYPRSSYVLLTKVWAPMGEGPNDSGLSAKHIIEQCEASLKRLDMDYVDIYMFHRPDLDVPLEESIRAMEDLIRQGKVLYWGVSEWSSAQMVKANAVAKQINARAVAVNQPRYSLLYRYPELDVFPTTAEEGIGNVVFSPLAHGMLTGKYLPGEEAKAGTRAADPDQNVIMRNMYWTEENKVKGQKLVEIAKSMGVSAAQLAIAWCLRRSEVSSVITGATSVSQLEENIEASEIEIPGDVLKKLDELYPAPKMPS